MTFVDILSLYDIIAIWSLLLVNVALSIGGIIYYLRDSREEPHKKLDIYPMVSVMVPAHNEGVVIAKTMQALLNFDYPKDRYEIIVINDNSNDDGGQILEDIQRKNPDRNIIVLNTDKIVGGKGKSRALNIGLSVASGSILAVYDADNTPEHDALRILVENLMSDNTLGAVIGKFRTRNRNASILTRFINIETLAYQCMNQAGRWYFLKLCTIPGTNFVIRRELIEEMGGWDEHALSEDTEISFRIYRMGFRIKLVPQAVTWEQEPQYFGTWFKQRTRWAKGNLYVLKNNFKYVFDKSAGIIRLDVLYSCCVYFLMLSALVFSDTIFVLGLLGLAHSTLGGFSSILWIMAIVLFVLNILITLALEKNEFNIQSALLILVMLFTYAKLWVLVVLNAMRLSLTDAIYGRETKWYKTERVAETANKAVGRAS